MLGSLFTILFVFVFALSPHTESRAGEPEPAASSGQPSATGGEGLPTLFADDGSYFVRSLYRDAVDLVKLPLRINEVTLPDVLVATVVVGTIPATVYGLDDRIRRNVKNIPDSTAGTLQSIGQGTSFGTLGLLYGWGLYARNDDARHAVLTGMEGIGLSSLLTVGMKYAFGRKRPNSGAGPKAFFQGGQSFVSGDTTPTFAAAAAISEAFDYHWWAAVPAYSLAVMTGVGRMGKDAHWASDILGSALVGAGTTELLFYFHRQREKPSSLIILPMLPGQGAAGLTVAFSW
ncbi:MAG TPA: phosphatase PAP2 family protein [Candidatus Binatia bacterium]|jgi:membrane-associated phospholipid phosphatase